MLRNMQNRLAAIEARMFVGLPVYAVKFADGRTKNMDVVKLLMRLLDDESGLNAVAIVTYVYQRGDVRHYAALVRLVGGQRVAENGR